jgi:hypothetical protein
MPGTNRRDLAPPHKPRCAPPCDGRGMAIGWRCTWYGCARLAAIQPKLPPGCWAPVPVSTVQSAVLAAGAAIAAAPIAGDGHHD